MNELLQLTSSPEAWISLLTLSLLEVVLGIDNLVFITILAGRLPQERQLKARRVGLALALITRIGLLATLSWLVHLTVPIIQWDLSWLFRRPAAGFLGYVHLDAFVVAQDADALRKMPAIVGAAALRLSWKDLVLLAGGLFLVTKATLEIYDKVEARQPAAKAMKDGGASAFASIMVQIMLFDIIFSIDSVITAVGMANHLPIMVLAVVIAVIAMIIFAGPVGDFVEKHPSVKILALAFLVLIGVMLVAESTGHHIPKGYVYFGMAFSLGIEFLNMRYRKSQERLQVVQTDAVLRPAVMNTAS